MVLHTPYQCLRVSPCLMQFEEWMSPEGMMSTLSRRIEPLNVALHRDVTDHLQLLLRKSGHHLHTTAEREVVRIIKEKCCYIALNPSKEEKDTVGRTEEFRLPDGNVVQVSSQPLVCKCHSHLSCSWDLSGSAHPKSCLIQNLLDRNTPVFIRLL